MKNSKFLWAISDLKNSKKWMDFYKIGRTENWPQKLTLSPQGRGLNGPVSRQTHSFSGWVDNFKIGLGPERVAVIKHYFTKFSALVVLFLKNYDPAWPTTLSSYRVVLFSCSYRASGLHEYWSKFTSLPLGFWLISILGCWADWVFCKSGPKLLYGDPE